MAANLRLTAAAAAELGRQAAVAGTPGQMHLELIPVECAQHVIQIRPGHLAGVAIARADGEDVMVVWRPQQVRVAAGGVGENSQSRHDLIQKCTTKPSESS